MKIQTVARLETRTGEMEDTEYAFDNGPHMMQILSGLYANPDEAMVREYLTNMYDAHIALHRATGSWGEKPCLTLPTVLSPVLMFQDHGIGMTRETIKNIYTRYGKSTKSGNDDEVGGFGLGAKVAFAYNGGVDWSVSSVRDGERNMSIARIGPNGMPVLSAFPSEPCDEARGTCVSIPVRHQDVNRIQDAAEKYLRYFPIPIQVVNADFELSPRGVVLQGATWNVAHAEHSERGLTVVVGNVPYKVTDQEARAIRLMAGLNTSFYWRNDLVLMMPVGSVDIVPSRDNLKYTDKTRVAVAEAWGAMARELLDAAAQLVAHATTEYEALTMFLAFDALEDIRTVIDAVVYRGVRLERGRGIVRDVTAFPGTTFAAYGIEDPDRAAIVELDCTKEVSLSTQYTYMFLNDMGTGSVRVAKTLANQELVNRNSNGRACRYGHHRGHVLVVTTQLSAQELSDRFGGFPVAQIHPVSRYRALKTPAGLTLSSENIYKFSGRSWSPRVNIPTDGALKYYLPMTMPYARYTYAPGPKSAEQLIEAARELGVLTPRDQVYGIRSQDVKDFDATQWINLEEALGGIIAQQIATAGATFAQAWLQQDDVRTGLMQNHIAQDLTDYAPCQTFHALYETRQEYIATHRDLIRIVSRYSHLPEVVDALGRIEGVAFPMLSAAWDEVMVRYPMIALLASLLNTYEWDTTWQANPATIREYMTQRDA